MADYIKHEDAINEAICAVYWALNQHGNVNGQVIIDRFNSIPSADVVEVKHGKWINGECSECGGDAPFWPMATTYYRSNFCPDCGARMDGE